MIKLLFGLTALSVLLSPAKNALADFTVNNGGSVPEVLYQEGEVFYLQQCRDFQEPSRDCTGKVLAEAGAELLAKRIREAVFSDKSIPFAEESVAIFQERIQVQQKIIQDPESSKEQVEEAKRVEDRLTQELNYLEKMLRHFKIAHNPEENVTLDEVEDAVVVSSFMRGLRFIWECTIEVTHYRYMKKILSIEAAIEVAKKQGYPRGNILSLQRDLARAKQATTVSTFLNLGWTLHLAKILDRRRLGLMEAMATAGFQISRKVGSCRRKQLPPTSESQN